MKQSKRLLSILLAMLMLFSVVSVSANAVLQQTSVNYDSIDNAALTPGQMAELLLDYVDRELLADIKDVDLSVLGTLKLNNINNAVTSIKDLVNGGWFAIGKGLIADVGMLNFDAINAITLRTDNNNSSLALTSQLVLFLGDNSATLGKIAYGIGTTNGIDLGLIGSFLDTSSLGVINDIPGLLLSLVFDNLLYRSYAYPSADDVELYASAPATVYTEWEDLSSKPFSNADTMLNTALFNLLTDPQEKSMVNENGTMVRKWNENSVIMPDASIVANINKNYANKSALSLANAINVNNNSIFSLLDNVLQTGYDELAIAPLNHDLKKVIMEATGVDFIRVLNPSQAVLDAEAAVTDNVNYFVNASCFKVGDDWYFRDHVKESVLDENGDKTYDENKNEVVNVVDRYFKADASGANEFYDLVNWDYALKPGYEGGYDFAAGLTTYSSIFGQLNHIVSYLIDNVLAESAKADIMAFLGDGTTPAATCWVDGDNKNLNANLLNIAKYVVCTYARSIFGKNSEYVENGVAKASFVTDIKKQTTIEGIVAYIGIPLMMDAMPQLIMPKNKDGYAFSDGLQVEQLGALVLREFMTDVIPQDAYNYDAKIFAAGTLTSATGRQFATHTDDEWMDIILEMGLDLGAMYLDNITNIDMDQAKLASVKAAAVAAGDAAWKGTLEEIVDWAVAYIGTGSSGALVGINPSDLGSVRGTYNRNAFDILSNALNKVLPLGFMVGCTEGGYDFNVETFFDKLLDIVKNLDIAQLIGFLGRNTTAYNILLGGTGTKSEGLVTTVIKLLNRILNLVLGDDSVLQSTASLNEALISQEQLKNTIIDLINGLSNRRNDILNNVLPIVGQFWTDIGGEQKLTTPKIQLSDVYNASSGAITDKEVRIYNAAKGLWRGYMKDGSRVRDAQYTFDITGFAVAVVSGAGTTANITATGAVNGLGAGSYTTAKFSVSGVPAEGAILRFTTSYKVYNEEGAVMADGATFTTEKLVYVSRDGANNRTRTQIWDRNSEKDKIRTFTPYFFNLSDMNSAKNYTVLEYSREQTTAALNWRTDITSGTASGTSGITFTNISQTISGTQENEAFGYNPFSIANDAAYQTLLAAQPNGSTLNWTVNYEVFKKNIIGKWGSEKTGNFSTTFYFYDGVARNDVISIADRERNRNREESDYYMTDCYASKVLRTAAEGDLKKETNFGTGVDPETNETVTVVNGQTAFNTYQTALAAAFRAAYQPFNSGNFVYNFTEATEALRVAAADLDICIKAAADVQSTFNIGAEYATIKDLRETTEAGITNYKDYMLYRWDRYTSARNGVNNFLNTYEAARGTVETKYFPYANIKASVLTAAIATDGYKDYITALLKDYTEKELEANDAARENANNSLAGYTQLDVAQAENLYIRMAARLLPREGGVSKTYLKAEIDSAKAMLNNKSALYTSESWARYTDALAVAEAEYASGVSNGTAFDAKYELQRARNELIEVAAAADYTELTNAIAYANAILANLALYDFTGKDKDLMVGKLLSNLGYEVTVDGDTVQLFPNAAALRLNNAYDKDHQYKIDEAAIAIKNATKEFKLTTANVAPAAGVTSGSGLVVDAGTEEEEVLIEGAWNVVPQLRTPKNIGSVVAISSPSVQTDTITYETSDKAKFIGTGKLVIAYGMLGGSKVVVGTYTAVVMGDVNGDGAVDALDAIAANLAATGKATLKGASFAACHESSDEATMKSAIGIEDFSAILNASVGLVEIV